MFYELPSTTDDQVLVSIVRFRFTTAIPIVAGEQIAHLIQTQLHARIGYSNSMYREFNPYVVISEQKEGRGKL